MVFPSTLDSFPRNFLVFLLVDFFIAFVDFYFLCCLVCINLIYTKTGIYPKNRLMN